MTVEIANRQRLLRVPRKKIAEVVDHVMAGRGLDGVLVSVAVVDDATIRTINREFLDRDEATDVISFPLSDPPKQGRDSPGSEEPRLLGEIVVSAQRARRTAQRRKGAPSAELLLYVVHGLLHLLGLDDDTPERASHMHQEALCILRQHGVRGVT